MADQTGKDQLVLIGGTGSRSEPWQLTHRSDGIAGPRKGAPVHLPNAIRSGGFSFGLLLQISRNFQRGTAIPVDPNQLPLPVLARQFFGPRPPTPPAPTAWWPAIPPAQAPPPRRSRSGNHLRRKIHRRQLHSLLGVSSASRIQLCNLKRRVLALVSVKDQIQQIQLRLLVAELALSQEDGAAEPHPQIGVLGNSPAF